MEIIDFLLARIGEDEELAESLAHDRDTKLLDGLRRNDDALADFVQRWSPWRVFSLGVLGRRLSSAHMPILGEHGVMLCSSCDDRRRSPGWPCRIVLLLANGSWRKGAAERTSNSSFMTCEDLKSGALGQRCVARSRSSGLPKDLGRACTTIQIPSVGGTLIGHACGMHSLAVPLCMRGNVDRPGDRRIGHVPGPRHESS